MDSGSTNDAPLMLSVSGARGIVGASMTPEVAYRLATLWGRHLASEAEEDPTVVLARDSRPSGPDLAHAAAGGLAQAGCRVISLDVVATPTVGVMIQVLRAVGGIMITASHNPAPWNGLKLLDGRGTAPPADVAGRIIDGFRGPEVLPVAPEVTPPPVETRANDTHLARVLGQIDPAPIIARNFRVVLDSVNGAGGPAGARLLKYLGCEVIHLNATPDGDFAHPPEPKREHLGALAEAVAEADADVGFAQDPDADRLAIIDERGRYVGEEHTLALATRAVLSRHPGSPAVANLSTSRLIDDVAAGFGSTVHRSAVGEANVAQVMREVGAIVGGEGNGGVMLPAVTWVRDSLSAMALVLDLLARDGETISGVVGALPALAMIKQTITLEGSGSREALQAAMATMSRHYGERPDARILTTDGVRVDLPGGWAHLRPSNTEPIARLIVEAGDAAAAEALATDVRRVVGL